MIFSKIKAFFKPTPEQKLEKLRERVLNIYSQKEDRQYAMSQARDLRNEDGIRILIARFTVRIQNSTVDIDEKQLASDYLVDLGEMSIDPLKRFLTNNDKDFNWPFKTLERLINEPQLIEFMTHLLESIGPDYVRDPERKEQLILSSKRFGYNESLARAVLPYLRDDNETIRFVACECALAHAYDFDFQALSEALPHEDSQRVITHILNGFIKNDRALSGSHETLSAIMPDGYILGNDMKPKLSTKP